MLRGGKNLELAKDQEVVLVAVGAAYKTWEGGMNPDTGEGLGFGVGDGQVCKNTTCQAQLSLISAMT